MFKGTSKVIFNILFPCPYSDLSIYAAEVDFFLEGGGVVRSGYASETKICVSENQTDRQP